MSENDVVAACKQYLDLRGIFCWRQNQGAIPLPSGGFRRFVGRKGVSDILGIVTQTVRLEDGSRATFGNLLAIECKTRTGRVSDDQKAFLKEINDRGGIALVVHSVDELIAGLEPFL